MLFASRVKKKSENTAYLTIFRGAQKCENKLCCKNNNNDDDDDKNKNKKKNKNKNHNNNNSNNNKRKKNKHKNATKRCVVRWLQAAV